MSLANKKIPSLDPVDLICPLLLLRNMFRQLHGKALADPNHDTIYIFLTETDARTNLHPPTSSSGTIPPHLSAPPLPDIDLQQLHSCRTIPKNYMFYLTTCLHCHRHGSGMSDSPAFLQGLNKLESMFIPVNRLAPQY